MAVDVSAFVKWFVTFRNPQEIWREEPTFLMCEIVFLLIAAMTFRHALRNGKTYILLWITLSLHGLTTECVSYFVPDVDNFWHAQSMVMLVEKRLPLHIVLFYPGVMYTVALSVAKLRLPLSAEPFAVGLADVIFDFPFDIMGIKLLWWSWHDTDPNLFDRHYWVPWTSYIFHMTFASSFTFIFHGMRWALIGVDKFQPSKSWFKELTCVLVAGVFSMPLGVVQFIVFYHIPHDMYGIHTEVLVLLMCLVYGVFLWRADRNPRIHSRPDEINPKDSPKTRSRFDEISFNVLIHFLFYVFLVGFAHPENVRATGLHQRIGNCSHVTAVHTPLGQVLQKKTFLCPRDYDEGYFDWHCTPSGHAPPDGTNWYTLCGTGYPNHAEYILVVTSFCMLGLAFYYQLLWRSAMDVLPRKDKGKMKSN
ncbi:uncharacterized protein LOC5515900 isoform X2 [Nematostella vectensis]|uniref:uncharacterized protein LOC5515900 isoform X2 n=1 Tax=Nematostella vectensis TaxID=45351 RepID=UPI00207790E8|nr:uncharacterized protein LOC5515900 isoform X2 [Nematostella vectensis]